MSLPPDELDPGRLLDAADAVLKAFVEVTGVLRGRCVDPRRLMGSASLCEYTIFEVEEATRFLARLGFLSDQRAKP